MVSRVDLHVHSAASDGADSPERVVARALAAGVTTLAVCDHDTVAGVPAAVAAGRAEGVTVVPAVELTCFVDGRSVHVLGYGVAPDDPLLAADLADRQAVRQRHVRRLLDRLEQIGCPLSPERVAVAAGGGTPGRPHVAAALVAAGYASDVTDAFDRYLRRGRPAYLVPAEPRPPADAVALLHRVGALAVLAHPAMDRGHLLIPELVTAGLDGIEVWHARHTPGLVAAFEAEARRHGLLMTGGSDNHGAQRPPDIGEVAVPDGAAERLLAALAERAASWEQG